jgi:hypothetical protein
MTSPEKKAAVSPDTSPLGNEVGLRGMTRELVSNERRQELVLEHRIELSRGAAGPTLKLYIDGKSVLDFLRQVEQAVPEIRQRDLVVGLVLDTLEKNPALNLTFERSTIELSVGRSDKEWADIRDQKLRAGIASGEFPLGHLAVVSGARHLLDIGGSAEVLRRDMFTRADKWIAALVREQREVPSDS